MKIDRPVAAIIADVFRDLPTIETERLLLKRLCRADAEGVLAYTSDPEVVRHLPLKRSASHVDALGFIHGFVELYEKGLVAPWGVSLKATGLHIGVCGFENWAPRSDRAEMGFMFRRDLWGQGYAREAARAVIEFGFSRMELNRIEAKTALANEQAQRLLKRLGLGFEGVLRESMYWKGGYHDMGMYALLRREAHLTSGLDQRAASGFPPA